MEFVVLKQRINLITNVYKYLQTISIADINDIYECFGHYGVYTNVMRKKKMKNTALYINRKKFDWGLAIEDLNDLYPEITFEINANKYSKSVKAKGDIEEVLGFKIIQGEFHSISPNRIINRVEFEIDLDDIEFEEIVEFINQNMIDPTYVPDRIKGNSHYNTKTFWHLNDYDLGLGIQQSIDTNKITKINLYAILRDVELLFNKYGSELFTKSKTLNAETKETNTEISKYQTKQNQMWSCQYELGHYSSFNTEFVSTAINGFYDRQILITPDTITNNLRENEICFIHFSNTNNWYLANKYESVELNQNMKIRWTNTLPAKGSGYSTLYIGDLKIIDDHSREETKNIVAKLERITGNKIIESKAYDC
ncbi:hypothetical protein [uncultured Arcticibacterium sp.]|uniref:hypothetical protein n=1 Tax=uncultured Arcticibacterium sp. TaxID=2173042 RepID=UPI0030F901B9